MKVKIGRVIREGVGWATTGVGCYAVFANGFTLLNSLILFIGLIGIILNLPYNKKQEN